MLKIGTIKTESMKSADRYVSVLRDKSVLRIETVATPSRFGYTTVIRWWVEVGQIYLPGMDPLGGFEQ
jgi:hypothetical protein